MNTTTFFKDYKINERVKYLDLVSQKDLIISLVFSKGYNLYHEENGFVKLVKFCKVMKK